MRILFITGGGSATVFALVPLVQAARLAGHEVVVASPEESVEICSQLGLPSVGVTDLGIYRCMFWDRAGNKLPMPQGEDEEMDMAGRAFARLAVSSYPALERLAESWRPDLVVGGSHTHAAPLLAHQFKIPFVRQAWDIHERTEVDWRAATDELREELAALGLSAIPEGELYIDTTPPSLRPEDAESAQMMRWTPGNRQVPLEPWTYAKGDRPRVLLTSGSRSTMVPTLGSAFFRRLIGNPAFEGAEIVVATSEQVGAEIRAEHPEVHAGWLPLDAVLPTCDLLVHHGGGVTTMNALNAGVPQLVLPVMASSAIPIRRVDAYGASITLPSAEESAEDVAAAAKKLLTDPSYRQRAQELSREIAAQPLPHEVIRVLERLTAAHTA
ncbi:nucleotide disphospho-sugar-binding domain-containing protein [Streptomyces sp. NPDC087440]|uniref:nucleotide disphospho-sugar-binding domain-containing protein n=1 Tax=Streptomyces sp. NPDC087440 TaxID=3365790 RepID=UPI00380765F8